MERSEYMSFMDCYRETEAIYHFAIAAAVAFECVAEHWATDAPFTDEDNDAAEKEIARRLSLSRGEICVHALITWAQEGIKRRYGQSEENADQ